jgi:hypothetical protein
MRKPWVRDESDRVHSCFVLAFRGMGSLHLLEALEDRTLFSAAPIKPGAVPESAGRAARPVSLVIAFTGDSGIRFANAWLGAIANATGSATRSVVRIYRDDQRATALKDLFHSLDLNRDHTLSAAEISRVTIRAVGLGFGADEATNFTEYLDETALPVLGYKLEVPIPIESLVTLDPSQSPPFASTNGPEENVHRFTNFYELNFEPSTLLLLDRQTLSSVGSVTISNLKNQVGGDVGTLLDSTARSTQQTLLGFGNASPMGNRVVTHDYNSKYLGSMAGYGVNDSTLPWYAYSDAITALE